MTIALIFLLQRSRVHLVRSLALFLAMAAASALPLLLGWESVSIVRDVATIPRSLPQFVTPTLSLVPNLLLPAVALGILGFVQGESVAQLYPNPGGNRGRKRADPSRNFLGQRLANLATSFFRGIPAGSSTFGTAVLVGAGAQTRWVNIFVGIWVAIIVLVAGKLAESVAMPALAGLLIVVGLQMFNFKAVVAVWQTGLVQRVSAGITFVAALVVPLQIAILIGVVVAVLLYVFRQSQKVVLTELIWSDELFPEERPVPKELPSYAITTLRVYGSLFFAAAGTFERLLPAIAEARRPVVLLLLRGHTEMGSTFINALTRYARQLAANDGRLMLVGLTEDIYEQLDKTGTIADLGKKNLFLAQPQWGLAAQRAYTVALNWLGEHAPE